MAASRTTVRKNAREAASKGPVRDGVTLETFIWEGTDRRGTKMKGEEQSRSANLVRAQLRQRGINPTVVRTKPKPLFGGSGKRITPKDIAIFTRQLATMMKSGVPIVQALEIIGNGQKNAKFGKLIHDLRLQIEGGSSIAEAMGKYPVQFDELYRNLVKTGESAGVLETVLDSIATYKENIESLKGKIKKALFYPATVILVALVVSAILLIFVIPTFEETFQSFGADLPAFTLFVLGISRFMVKWWWLILLVMVGSGVLFVFLYKRSPAMQHGIDRLMLKVPVIGKILNDAAVARFSRTLAVTFRAGVPLTEALTAVAGATGNQVYEKAVFRMRDDVSVGYPVNLAMKQTNLFPHMVIQMTAIGEEAGALDTMLTKVAEFYEEEVNNAVDALSSLIEPIIIVFLGVIVGGMVVAMYLPIFKLAATV